jgi:hypothetical protein
MGEEDVMPENQHVALVLLLNYAQHLEKAQLIRNLHLN